MAPAFTNEEQVTLRELGGDPVAMSFDPSSASPFVVLLETLLLAKQFRYLKLDVVMAFFIKASVVATLASVIAGVKGRFVSIEGLGHFLSPTNKRSLLDQIRANLIGKLLRICATYSTGIFFLNKFDAQNLLSGKHYEKTFYLEGVGVDLDEFENSPIPKSKASFVFIGRLLFAKGIADYAAAAAIVLDVYPEVTFFVVGIGDGTARSVRDERVLEWQADGKIIWLGQLSDVRPAIARSTALILPSFGEGAPRSIQEAMAMGRPVITTTAAGCREIVQHNVNGLLVPPGDPNALARAITLLIDDPELATKYGIAARQWAEAHFDDKAVAMTIKDTLRKHVGQM